MSDTPETDALREAIDNGAATEAEMTSLAGKLERELVAQEERQGAAGDRCGLLYWEYGFDWPDAMADELLRTREERDQARRELDIQLESIKFHMERVPVMEHPLRANDAKLFGENAAK